jgi:hypothetical protein
MDIIEKSRETVEQLLARRSLPKTYEEKCQYALDLVDIHLHEENPDRIHECIKLYTEDAIWETPARNVSYRGRETIKNMYLRVFNSARRSPFIRSSASQRPTAYSTICGRRFASRAMALRISRSPSAPR